MPYTLGQAAKATGKQKSTILDAIKNGRLSASRDDKKQWQIDPAELFRVYPQAVQPNDTEHEETPPSASKNTLLEAKIGFLEREIARLEQTAADLRADREDLRQDRDHWRRQATNLLTHQPANQSPPPRQEAPAKRRAWPVLVALLALAGGMAGGLYAGRYYGLF